MRTNSNTNHAPTSYDKKKSINKQSYQITPENKKCADSPNLWGPEDELRGHRWQTEGDPKGRPAWSGGGGRGQRGGELPHRRGGSWNRRRGCHLATLRRRRRILANSDALIHGENWEESGRVEASEIEKAIRAWTIRSGPSISLTWKILK